MAHQLAKMTEYSTSQKYTKRNIWYCSVIGYSRGEINETDYWQCVVVSVNHSLNSYCGYLCMYSIRAEISMYRREIDYDDRSEAEREERVLYGEGGEAVKERRQTYSPVLRKGRKRETVKVKNVP